MERSSLPRIVKYFYVNPCVIRLIFTPPAMGGLLACNLFGIGPQSHVDWPPMSCGSRLPY